MGRFVLEAVALASKVTGTHGFPEELAVLLQWVLSIISTVS